MAENHPLVQQWTPEPPLVAQLPSTGAGLDGVYRRSRDQVKGSPPTNGQGLGFLGRHRDSSQRLAVFAP